MSYEKVKKWMEENPGVHPNMRKWAEGVNASIGDFVTTTTTTSTTTTTTTTTT